MNYWTYLAQNFYRRRHFLLANLFVFLLLCSSLKKEGGNSISACQLYQAEYVTN